MRPRDIKTDKISKRAMDFLTALHIYHEGHKIHKQNAFQDYYLDGEGEGRFSKRVQLTLGINPFTKEPGGISQAHVFRQDAVVAATNFNLSITAKEGEIWAIDRITGKHTDNAAKAIEIQRWDTTNFTGASPVIMQIIDEVGIIMTNNVETVMFPTMHDKTDKHDHIIGRNPLIVYPNFFLLILNAEAMTNGKAFTLKYTAWRLK